MVGLDGTGKSTIRKMLKRDIMLQIEPTGGWGVSMYLFRWRFKEYIFSICEIRGNKNSRYLWRDFEKEPFWASFLPDVCGVVFVVDNQLWCGKNGRSKWTLFFPSSRACRKSTINCLPALPCSVVIANKQDLPGALTTDEVFDQLSCERYKSFCWEVIFEFIAGMRILCKMIKKREKYLKNVCSKLSRLSLSKQK